MFYWSCKDRYKLIVQTYNYLNDSGVTTYFGVGRPPKDIVKEKGIHYFPYVMPYEKYLQFVINTNCIVEILQDGTTGYTLRTWEALAFNKKLLTNNPEIINAEFYNNKQFSYFENIEI